MTTRRQRWLLVVVCAGSLVIGIDNLILNVALPTLVHDLRASTAELQWIVDSYILAFAGLLLTGGSLGDRLGRAKTLRLGLAIFGTASVLASFATNATALTVWRFAMGVGAALILPNSVGVIANAFVDGKDRGRAFGVWSAFTGLGLALGPVVGGVLLSQFWWGSVFLVNVPIVIALLLGGWWAIPESRNPSASRFDPLGVVLSVVSVSGLVWATIEAPTHGWGSAATLRSFAVAIVLLGCFVVWELKSAHPMLELRFFTNPRFSVANLASSTASFAFAGSLFVLTQLLQFVFGYSPLKAGLALIPFSVAFIVGGVLGPRLAERVGTHRGVAIGLTTFATGLCVLAIPSGHPAYAWIAPAMFAIGVGPGLLHAPTTDAAVGSVHREQAGVAAGTNSTGRQVATALGVAIMGSVLVSGYRSSLAGHTSALSKPQLTRTRASVGGALEVADRIGGAAGRALGNAARAAFDHGMRVSFALGAVMLVVVAILALRYLPAHAVEQLDTDGAVELAALDAVIID